MPDVELRADYDRDGRLSGSAAEYAARGAGHGAILGVNVDRDGRALPAAARVAGVVPLDFTRPTKDGRDRDPLDLHVVVAPAALAGFSSLALRVRGDNADAVGLLDDRARVLSPTRSRSGEVEFALPLQSGRHGFKLEARRVPGSPLGQSDGALAVHVIGRDASGAETAIDAGRFQLARFLVLDDLAPARQLYICDLPDNHPSVRDVRDGLAGLSPAVALRVVDMADSLGDGWLQDQFQLGYVVTPAGTMRAVLHLPRLRKNAQIGPNQRNLAQLVRTHFPSTNLGLIEDFWRRQVPIRHRGGVTPVAFEVSEEAFRILHKVLAAEDFLREAIMRLCAAAPHMGVSTQPPQCANLPAPMSSLPLIRTQLPELQRRVERLVTTLLPKATHSQEPGLRAIRARARALMREIDRQLAVAPDTGGEVFELALSVQTFRIEGGDLVDLHDKVTRMHDSLVYGGNIEASPPLSTHPFGKVVIGEGNDRLMDPPLRDLFDASDAIQPVVSIDTSWLGVGHVDELICFLPDRNADDRHVILRASPEVAFALFDKASELYRSGISSLHPDNFSNWRPLTIARHEMGNGSHPVTRLFRGKLWLHAHPQPPAPPDEEGGRPGQEIGEIHNPPRIYLRMVDWFGGILSDTLAPYYPHSDLDTHYYKAAISPWEIEFFDGGTNQAIVDQKLGELDRVLQEEFSEFTTIKVPVLFDRVRELGAGATAAFTPDVVNLQYVNGRVLIPNPFGPRMRPDDAIQVVQHVLRAQGLGRVAGNVSARWLRRRRLDVTEIWINPDMDGGTRSTPFRSVSDLAREFRDGFPHDMPRAEIEDRLRRANRSAFDGSGDLKSGWRKIVIPENTVDLFQAYTQAVVESLNVQLQWVDCWFYHVRFGEIHCGTNVLRSTPSVRTPWWTRLAPPSASTGSAVSP